MKHLLLLFILLSSSLFSLNLSKSLPQESLDIINSFECFTKDEKTLLTSYMLTLKYRMEHLEDKDALVESDLNYWRLWYFVSDIRNKYNLSFNFDNIMEETITPTNKEKNILKKLRRIRSSQDTNKISESYTKAREIFLLNTPQYTIIEKNKLLADYNLTTLKHYPKMSIPKNIYDKIQNKNITNIEKYILIHYALLKELMIRKYDKPKDRNKMAQEMIYIKECKKYYEITLNADFYQTHKRKLAIRSISSSHYNLKRDFLPKEIESYCENNITKRKVSTFILKKEKKLQVKKKTIKLKNLERFLGKYENDAKKKKFAEQYFNLMKTQLNKSSTTTPNLESLKLLRLKNCLVSKDTKTNIKLIFAQMKDFSSENIKETFYTNIFNSQVWWKTTIKMKIDSEGISKELETFFDCNQTSVTINKTNLIQKKESTSTIKSNYTKAGMRKAIMQKNNILKYYAKIFENKSAYNLNNKRQ